MSTYRYSVVSRSLPGDLHTPVSAYLRLRDASTRSILMESSDYHTRRDARSFIGLEPLAEVGVSHGTGFCHFPDGTAREHAIDGSYPCERLVREFLDAFELDRKVVGLWGYTSFNAVRYFEDIPVKDETRAENDAPDLLYILFRYVLEFDHFRNRLTLHELIPEGAEAQSDRIERLLGRPAANL